jgi:hypothetical protein
MFFNKMSRSQYYKTSNDLSINAKNGYPFYPTENIENNPYLKKPWLKENISKKVSFSEPVEIEQQPEELLAVNNNEMKYESVLPNEVTLKMQYKTEKYANTANPVVWGPAFWFSLHNGALRYPIQAAPLWKERMKHFILGIPVMVPCEKCSDHATAYLESNYYRIDEIVTSRSKLFEFFWEFHNVVNRSLGKPEMSLQKAYEMYSGEVEVSRLVY